MPTLKELLEGDLGASQEKTAAVQSTITDESIEKIAMELGLFGDTEKVASEDEGSEEDKKEDEKEEETKKEASMSLDNLYGTMFPEDADLGTTKTASDDEDLVKEAAEQYEEALGERAHDYFAARWEARMGKLAAEMLGGASEVDVDVPQALPTNKPANANSSIDTTPVVDDEITAKNDEKQVGHVEQKKLAMAIRKHMLLGQLED